MAGSQGIPIVDTMIGFAAPAGTDRELPQVRSMHRGSAHTAEYMFGDVPADERGDPIDATLAEMDRYGVAVGLVNTSRPEALAAADRHPDRFVLETHVGQLGEPLDILGEVRRIRTEHADHDTRAVSIFPVGPLPPVAIDAAAWYPIYATCVELGLPVFVNAGVGSRVPATPQHVERFDRVCYDFPELTIVMRHGGEPWTDLAVKLMLKWPGLHYSTSALRPATTQRQSSTTPTPEGSRRSSTAAISRWRSALSGSSVNSPIFRYATMFGNPSWRRTLVGSSVSQRTDFATSGLAREPNRRVRSAR